MRLKWPITQLSIYCLLITSVSFAITFGLVHHKKSTSVSINSSTSQVVTTAVHQYTLGETGPGGGTVFYYSAIPFTETGATCNTSCHYLEAAPTTGPNAWVEATYAWSGNTTGSIGTTRTAIGSGYASTLAMIAQDATAGMAGTVSRAYRGPNNLSDWFLPSRDELNQLYIARASIGGLVAGYYWSSSEYLALNAFMQSVTVGGQGYYDKYDSDYVRPVRAF